MQSNKERRKLKGIPRKSNAHRQKRKYIAYRNRVGRPAGPGKPGNKKGRKRVPSCVRQRDLL